MAQGSHAGRLSSWLAVVVMWIGFTLGGIALVSGPSWWLFWVSVGIVGVGGVMGLLVRIFDDVIIDPPRVVSQEAHPAVRHAHGGVASDPATNHPHG